MNAKRLYVVEFSNTQRKEWVLYDFHGWESRARALKEKRALENIGGTKTRWRVAAFERKA